MGLESSFKRITEAVLLPDPYNEAQYHIEAQQQKRTTTYQEEIRPITNDGVERRAMMEDKIRILVKAEEGWAVVASAIDKDLFA